MPSGAGEATSICTKESFIACFPSYGSKNSFVFKEQSCISGCYPDTTDDFSNNLYDRLLCMS